MPDAPIYRVGPSQGADVPNNREGPQAREPSKCLNGQNYGDFPKRPSDASYKKFEKRL